MTSQKFGCLLFDDPSLPKQGWLCREGAEPVRFDGLVRDDTTLWLTNIPAALVRRGEVQLGTNERVREFMKEDLIGFGARHAVVDNEQLASLGAALFGRICRLARYFVGKRVFSIAADLGESFYAAVGLHASYLADALAEIHTRATQYHTYCIEHAILAKTPLVTFMVPAQTHCQNILAMRLPYGRYSELPKAALPKPAVGSAEICAFVEAQNPGIYEVAIETDHDPLLGFWTQECAMRPTRRFVTSDELLFLTEHAQITLVRGFVTQSFCTLSQERISSLSATALLSLSCGICLDNYVNGLCLYDRTAQMHFEQQTLKNPLNAYLKAKDRILLYPYARALASAGLTVCAYGQGRILVARTEHPPKDLFNAACKAHLIPPFLSCQAKELPPPRKEDPLSYLQWWYGSGNLADMLEFDAKFVADGLLEGGHG